MFYRQLIIDGSYLARCSYESVGMARGFMSKLASLKQEYKPKHVLIAWDSQDNIRKEWYPHYKAKRNQRSKVWKERRIYEKQLENLKAGLQCFDIHQLSSLRYEADDVAKSIVETWPGKSLTYSADRDWLFLHSKHCDCLLPGKGLYHPDPNAPDIFNIKLLTGCTSDEVPGVPGVGPVRAKSLLSAIPNMIELITNYKFQEVKQRISKSNPRLLKYAVKCCKARDIIELNKKLIQLYVCMLIIDPACTDKNQAIDWLRSHGIQFLANKLF